MENISLYFIPIIQFVTGCILIYALKRYYLHRMTDYWGTNTQERKPNVEFNFDAGSAFWLNCILTFLLAISVFIYISVKDSRKHQRGLEVDALNQYKEKMKDDLKRETQDEIYDQLREDLGHK